MVLGYMLVLVGEIVTYILFSTMEKIINLEAFNIEPQTTNPNFTEHQAELRIN